MVNGIFGVASNLSCLMENLAGLSCTQFRYPMCTSELNLVDGFSAACPWDDSAFCHETEREVVGAVGSNEGSDAVSDTESALQAADCEGTDASGALQFSVDDIGVESSEEICGSRPHLECEDHCHGCRQDVGAGEGAQSGTGRSMQGGEVSDEDEIRSPGRGAVSSGQQCRSGEGGNATSVHSLGRVAEGEQVSSVLKESVKSCPRGYQSTFTWRRQKEEVFWVLGSFTMLLVAVMVTYCLERRRNIGFAVVWVLDASLCVLLWVNLWLDYNGSQSLCRTVTPVLFAMPALASLFPMGACRVMGIQGCVPLSMQTYDIMLLLGLPCLLSAAPIMAWQASVTLSLVLPASFLLAFSAETSPSLGVLSADHLTFACFFFMLALTPLVFLRLRAEEKLFSALEASEVAYTASVLQQRKAECTVAEEIQAWDDTKMDNADRISKMRQFISYIFHEIRVPFNAVVLGIGHMLAENISEDQREILKMMDSSASSMIRILNDVLDMGKIEAGRLHLEKQPFNMGELISSLVWSYQEIFDSKGIQFSLCVDDETNHLLSSCDVLGDKHRVGQVLANYLSNAAKFTPRGGKVCLHVKCTSLGMESRSVLAEDVVMDLSSLHSQTKLCSTTLRNDGTQQQDGCDQQKMNRTPAAIVRVTISVEDTGIGISKEDQSRLFEPYMQVHATSSQACGGTGLGLCFSKRIVELAGGTIGVRSEVGKGSTFLCTIPLELVPASPTLQAHPIRSTFDPSRALGGRPLHRCASTNSLSAASLEGRVPKVLIVEDNQVNRRILNKLLSSFSVESEDVENGEQAVDLCRGGARFDMILIDKEMPVMDGLEATRQLRAMGITTPIVGLTGNALESERHHFLAAGVDDFFTKPLSRNQLLKLLEAHGLMAKSSAKEEGVRSVEASILAPPL